MCWQGALVGLEEGQQMDGNVHECIVDGDDEDLAGAGELWVCDESGDVRIRAGWAWEVSVREMEIVPNAWQECG
jgi:hypothetical protein